MDMDRTGNVIKVHAHNNILSKEEFVKEIQIRRQPAVLKGVKIGDCCEKWTPEYLMHHLGHLEAKIHVSPESKMDFINKNFQYKTLSMAEIIKRSVKDIQEDYFINPNELYYLRSLSNERRGREVADLRKQYPQISEDIQIPPFFDEDDFFSSVLRISSKGIQLWTHYDIMDNLLIQVQGRKRVVLFKPSDVNYLYMDGDKSRVLDIDKPDLEKFPGFLKAQKYECILEPGDILFIPALWFHNTLALTYGVAVNVFWKNLDHSLYEKNDFYGNKDLVPAAKAFQNVENAVKLLSLLPEQYKDFYLRRCMNNMCKHLNTTSHHHSK
ncbi:tRNA wybutosine-synthesizing protein 5-like [Macrosteles quadrilineatus]|uniref:tRNA wybutosine-synthesizing protein 5-like n=1 Tax=Macrosteles quadrilineatus TaxID=74068 RepID=UPI0023E30F95|nr:tRNA wybutosine-synthesizing protein 5-like [Macrosteles quadrilineatus]XP_054277779.1 tRNA wybutosine-synthesizing protein 5-like [Macrosteles quadrilineatus]XP_054277780.1 tRNA wybutosine-synthesizing protein 5-like [Macrosteles quadrilineatus]XP_054277781.1 tRNA wybutosine-synthesizing protein 5-like [Macrosteles quadrilineatus]